MACVVKIFIIRRTKHVEVMLHILFFNALRLLVAFATKRNKITKRIRTIQSTGFDMMYFKYGICFTALHTFTAIPEYYGLTNILIQPVGLLILPFIRLITICQSSYIYSNIFKVIRGNVYPLVEVIDNSYCSLTLL